VDFEVFRWLSRHLPEGASVHFANSTSARYAQWFDWKGNRLHANRGVAGIDGCLSTAVGDALQTPSMPTFLISGDAAWLYDSNGLLVEPRPEAFKAIVINNGGGNIFRWLDGPAQSGLLERHFEAPFAENLAGSAAQLGLHYTAASDWDSLANGFERWLNNDAPGLLEIQTPGDASAAYMKALLDRISTAMNSLDQHE
jgi:2-succinyl-5-enolpyruvyl-6-hydroxy-3-cyclohexene-1-carboxylate synthase